MPEHHEGLPYLREMLIFLALSGVPIPLLQRYRVNQMLGFLAAGVLLGPFGLWLWVGQLPWLPGGLTPVWELLADRIR
mgnify:CR=1 FL=1